MRIAFAGTPAFAATILGGLLETNDRIALVVTQPDRPAGRGLRPAVSPVKRLAESKGLEVFQPASMKEPLVLERLADARPDVLVTAAYGLILPAQVLELAPKGAINVHASLLPRWRGAAPIQRALLSGDRTSGITIIRMDTGLDTGPMLAQRKLAITEQDDSGSLHDRLAALGAELAATVLETISTGTAQEIAQPAEGVTYASKIQDIETRIDWAKSAVEIERAVRAFRPAPGAQTGLRDNRCKIWRARVVSGQGEPGTVIAAGRDGIRVACGEDALEILELQRAGGRRLSADEFLRGFALVAGERLAIPG